MQFFFNFVAIVLKTYNLGFLSVNLKKMINEKNILSHISEHTHGSMKAALAVNQKVQNVIRYTAIRLLNAFNAVYLIYFMAKRQI